MEKAPEATTMKRVSQEEAIKWLLEREEKLLSALPKERLVDMLCNEEEKKLWALHTSELSNRIGLLSNGEFSVMRPDLEAV